jgi:hypothetical protein
VRICDTTRAFVRAVGVLAVAAMVFATPRPARAADDDATAQARAHYEMGLRLFDAREHDQALIEFDTANELKPRPAAVFMMAQCEYLVGRLKEARTHYQAYVAQSPDGEFVELAKDRIQSIDRRPGTFAINSVPDEVDVRIVSENVPERPPVTGQAPNNFPVPRGRYRITVSKKNYLQQSRLVDIDLAETKPLFFKLDEIPARLEIETAPPGATLYVNGNRALNPYRQDVAPGHYEVIAEAPEHDMRTIEFGLAPGQRQLMTGDNRFRLSYTQRSGRPELIVASGIIGGFIGAGGVAAAIGRNVGGQNVATVLLTGGGGVAGAIAGALIATPLVPRYIPDNRAFFILGLMWMGAAEGAASGMITRQIATYNQAAVPPCPTPCRGPIGEQLRAGFIGSIPGIGVGLTAGALLSSKAPTYGRVALIQSAALGGAFAGALLQVGLKWKPYGPGWEYTVSQVPDSDTTVPRDRCVRDSANNLECYFPGTNVLDLMPGALIGLNTGLLAGLLGAYLPDQSRYGPTWKRVLLVDLAAAAGALGGGIAGCVLNVNGCLNKDSPDEDARADAALWAIGGGVIGAVGGVLLTRHYDDEPGPAPAPTEKSKMSVSTTLLPLRTPDGRVTTGFGALGTF